MVVAPCFTVKPHPDCYLVTKPSVYTMRSCGLLNVVFLIKKFDNKYSDRSVHRGAGIDLGIFPVPWFAWVLSAGILVQVALKKSNCQFNTLKLMLCWYCGYWLFKTTHIFPSSPFLESPWYDHRSWLGVKSQLSIYLHFFFSSFLVLFYHLSLPLAHIFTWNLNCFR